MVLRGRIPEYKADASSTMEHVEVEIETTETRLGVAASRPAAAAAAAEESHHFGNAVGLEPALALAKEVREHSFVPFFAGIESVEAILAPAYSDHT